MKKLKLELNPPKHFDIILLDPNTLIKDHWTILRGNLTTHRQTIDFNLRPVRTRNGGGDYYQSNIPTKNKKNWLKSQYTAYLQFCIKDVKANIKL